MVIFGERYRTLMLTNDKHEVGLLQSSRHHSQSSVSENATAGSSCGRPGPGCVDSWLDGQETTVDDPMACRYRLYHA